MKAISNVFLTIIITTTFFSCGQAKNEIKEVLYVNMEDAEGVDYKDVVARQEIVELSDTDRAYMAGYSNMFVSDSIYLFTSKNGTLYLFEKNGGFISNSSENRGKGNKEYEILLAATYNKYSGNVEVLTPFGILMYDKLFNYVGKSLFLDKEAKNMMFNYIYDISANEHILLSPLAGDKNMSYMYVYDSKTRKITHKAEYEKECPFITMQEQCVSDENFIAFPCMNYSFFNMDLANYSLSKYITFDFGKKKLNESDYSHISNEHQMKKYLATECKKSLVLRTFKSGNKIISLVKSGKKRADIKTYIVDMNASKSKYLNFQYEKIKIPLFEAFNNGVLYACVSEAELEEYVDKSLLDEKSKDVLERHTEESNYYILKYYIK